MTRNDDDRFGFPESAFRSAADAHAGIVRMGMYVPTRRAVRTMAAEHLLPVLDLWMNEGPVELIPSVEQIREVLHELSQRPDRSTRTVAEAVALCQSYIREEKM